MTQHIFCFTWSSYGRSLDLLFKALKCVWSHAKVVLAFHRANSVVSSEKSLEWGVIKVIAVNEHKSRAADWVNCLERRLERGVEEPFHPRYLICCACPVLGRSLLKVAVVSLHKRLFCFLLAQTFSTSGLSPCSHKHCVAINEASESCSVRLERSEMWGRSGLHK